MPPNCFAKPRRSRWRAPPAHRGRVRVASPDLAKALRSGVGPGVEVVCAPTPELDEVLAIMRDRMSKGDDAEQSYVASGIDARVVASFFRAAAALFRAAPWRVIPGDGCILLVTVDELGARDAAVSVIGQMGQSLGFVLFSGVEDFDAYVEAAENAEIGGHPPRLPPHVAVSFERGADLSSSLRSEIRQHRWEVAGRDAYHWPVAMDAELVARPPTAKELTLLEAVARALTKAMGDPAALLRAWTAGDAFSRCERVRTATGSFSVTLRAPRERDAVAAGVLPAQGLLAELAKLENGEADIDDGQHERLLKALVERFCASPEAQSLTDCGLCELLLQYSVEQLGRTIASVGPRELRELLLEVIPRKLSVPPSAAAWIVDETRAFYAFLKREYGFEGADACLRVLEGDLAVLLESALSDPRNFGPAKAFVMSGGMDRLDGRERPSTAVRPAIAPLDPAAARARKNKRKAQRRARKGNR